MAKINRLGEYIVLTEDDGTERTFMLDVKAGEAEIWSERDRPVWGSKEDR